jgi:hypothetical protein
MSAGAASVRGCWGRTTPTTQGDNSHLSVLVTRCGVGCKAPWFGEAISWVSVCPEHLLGARTIFMLVAWSAMLWGPQAHVQERTWSTTLRYHLSACSTSGGRIIYCLMEEERATEGMWWGRKRNLAMQLLIAWRFTNASNATTGTIFKWPSVGCFTNISKAFPDASFYFLPQVPRRAR